MEANFACPHCQQALRVNERFFGSQVNCPHCNGPFMAMQPGPPAPPPPRSPRPGGPVPQRKPGRPMGHMATSSSMTAAAQAAEGEKKAKMLLIALFAGGLVILTGLLYFGSRFLQRTQERQSTLEEVNAITAQRDKEEAARRQKQDAEISAVRNRERAGEVANMTKVLSATVCNGNDQVAAELAKELSSIEDELDKAFDEGTQPKNLRAFVEQRLLIRFAGNEVLRGWVGKRSPQDFAQQVAMVVFGPPNSSPDDAK